MSAVLAKAFPSNLNCSHLPAKSRKKKLVASPRVSRKGELVMDERDTLKSGRSAKVKRKRGDKDSSFVNTIGYGDENSGFRVIKKESKVAVIEKKEKKIDEEVLDGGEETILQEEEESYLSDTSFDECPISISSLKGIKDAGYVKMSKVQEATFPFILQGKDVLAKAKTGTGKTVAFLLPAIEVLSKLPSSYIGKKVSPINVLVLCPTRELANQAAAEAEKLLKYHPSIGAQVVIGGTRLTQEQRNMQANPCQILIATPGRLKDHIENTTGFQARLKGVKILVLDEADRLLDMGFRRDIERIIAALPKERQTLLFSATVPKEVRRICHVAMRKDHEFVSTVEEGTEETHAQVRQMYLIAPLEKQLSVLHQLLTKHISQDSDYKVIVFCTTAMVTALVAEVLGGLKFNVREIHSRKSQPYRTRVSQEFRQSKGLILVSSDVSARGVDYPDVTLVIQIGMPSGREQYVHRLGRTGRKGKEGQGILMLAPWETCFLNALKDLPIQRLNHANRTQVAKISVHWFFLEVRILGDVDANLLSFDELVGILKVLARIDMRNKERAYQSWLGYYNSTKDVGQDKLRLVNLAREFSESMGLREPPALQRKVLSKMGLSKVPGFRSI